MTETVKQVGLYQSVAPGQSLPDVSTGSHEDPGRAGFHMRGFHGVTPETDTTGSSSG